ncbi:hypothetical protein AOE63_14685 [Listeria monocytogenes]|nr:hypothetical protein [Listeria monocytogenes]
MLNKLKIYQIDPANNVVVKKGKLITQLEDKVDEFFYNHILKSISNPKTKTARFKSKTNQALLDSTKAFQGETSFEEATGNFSYELSKNIHSSVKDDFLLVFIEYTFENEDSSINPGETILSILKMDAKDGIQYVNDEFDIKSNMLPDLGNQLQKCSFIYKTRIEKFELNNENEGFHLKVLDKQTENISNYFINLMSSAVVPNDQTMSKLAKSFVKKGLKKYANSEKDIENIGNEIESILSRRKKVSIKGIVDELSPFVSDKKLEEDGLTLNGLSNEIFGLMLQKNPSAQGEFTANPTGGERFTLRNKHKSVSVSIEKGLINSNIVEFDDSNEDFFTLKIPKDLVFID